MPYTTIQTALTVSLGQEITGQLSASGDNSYFKVPVSSGGAFNLGFTHPNGPGTEGKSIIVQLCDADGHVIVSKTFAGNGALIGTVPASGDYYVVVRDDESGNNYGHATGAYVVTTALSTAAATAYDGADNNTLQTAIATLADGATAVVPGKSLSGTLGSGGDTDCFKLQVGSGGKLTLGFTHPNGAGTTGKAIVVELRDDDGTVIVSQSFTGNGTLVGTVPAKGDYYVVVRDDDWNNDGHANGTYVVTTALSKASATAYDGADNNDLQTAIATLADGSTVLTPGQSMSGSIGGRADSDCFKLQVASGGEPPRFSRRLQPLRELGPHEEVCEVFA